MAASLESLFRIMGADRPTIRCSNVSIDKYFKLVVSHYQTQLGLDVDTRNMIVTLPESKRTPLLTLLRHWHSHRKSFVIKEASSLLGKLNFAAEVASWARFLFIQIRSSLLHCMRKNNTSAQNFEPIAKSRTLLAQHIFEHEDCDELIKKYSYLIDKVQFHGDTPTDPSIYIQVKPCSMHKGIQKQDGSFRPQPFIMFVDDNLMADTPNRI